MLNLVHWNREACEKEGKRPRMTHTPPSKPFPGRGRAVPCSQLHSALFISLKAPAMQLRHVWQIPHLTDSGLIGHWAVTWTCTMKHPASLPLTLPDPKELLSWWNTDCLKHFGPGRWADVDKGSAVGLVCCSSMGVLLFLNFFLKC